MASFNWKLLVAVPPGGLGGEGEGEEEEVSVTIGNFGIFLYPPPFPRHPLISQKEAATSAPSLGGGR